MHTKFSLANVKVGYYSEGSDLDGRYLKKNRSLKFGLDLTGRDICFLAVCKLLKQNSAPQKGLAGQLTLWHGH
jgi:hypothetical protein